MTGRRRRLGRVGERKAARYLKRRGLRILDRNWTHQRGELDVVARDGDVLVIVEVRTAAAASFAGGPAHTVGPEKRRRLARLAVAYRKRSRWRPRATRFDVVAVRHLGPLRWHRNAFTVDNG